MHVQRTTRLAVFAFRIPARCATRSLVRLLRANSTSSASKSPLEARRNYQPSCRARARARAHSRDGLAQIELGSLEALPRMAPGIRAGSQAGSQAANDRASETGRTSERVKERSCGDAAPGRASLSSGGEQAGRRLACRPPLWRCRCRRRQCMP